MSLKILVCGLLNDASIELINEIVKIEKNCIFYLVGQPCKFDWQIKFYTQIPNEIFDGMISIDYENWKSVANRCVKGFVYDSHKFYIWKHTEDKYNEIMSDNLKTIENMTNQDELVSAKIIMREMDDYFFESQFSPKYKTYDMKSFLNQIRLWL